MQNKTVFPLSFGGLSSVGKHPPSLGHCITEHFQPVVYRYTTNKTKFAPSDGAKIPVVGLGGGTSDSSGTFSSQTKHPRLKPEL